MAKRTRIINDPADLVPLIQTFESKKVKRVFDELSEKWRTEKELGDILGFNVGESLDLLRQGGLLESRWGTPSPGETPDKEYHSSYSRIMSNFQCSFQDFGDIIMIASMDEQEVNEIADVIAREVESGKRSVSNLCRTLDITPAFLKGISGRSHRVVVKGQRVELV
ncbi:MAG: ArsR family transcriptional regulator [Halobacteriota archaeon]|nr:ArsR family transcriptional regulator [Halobacteriota archaeon]